MITKLAGSECRLLVGVVRGANSGVQLGCDSCSICMGTCFEGAKYWHFTIATFKGRGKSISIFQSILRYEIQMTLKWLRIAAESISNGDKEALFQVRIDIEQRRYRSMCNEQSAEPAHDKPLWKRWPFLYSKPTRCPGYLARMS